MAFFRCGEGRTLHADTAPRTPRMSQPEGLLWRRQRVRPSSLKGWEIAVGKSGANRTPPTVLDTQRALDPVRGKPLSVPGRPLQGRDAYCRHDPAVARLRRTDRRLLPRRPSACLQQPLLAGAPEGCDGEAKRGAASSYGVLHWWQATSGTQRRSTSTLGADVP